MFTPLYTTRLALTGRARVGINEFLWLHNDNAVFGPNLNKIAFLHPQGIADVLWNHHMSSSPDFANAALHALLPFMWTMIYCIHVKKITGLTA